MVSWRRFCAFCSPHCNEKACADKTVETVEALSRDGKLHPLQQAFLVAGAVQCGFCTPGLIVAANALLQRNPEPSDAEIREALSGNICRCTGYGKILEAVHAVAKGTRA